MGELAAVLWDMDGTLVDSERLWQEGLAELAAQMGFVLTEHHRLQLVGSSGDHTMRSMFAFAGREPEPDAMAAAQRELEARTGSLFAAGLPWRPGAARLLAELEAEQTPMALVTNTARALTEIALRTIGAHRFSVSVCGDDVAAGKPDPEPYLLAAALLGVAPGGCLAVEDSPSGAASAEAAGMAVLVVPGEVPVPEGPRRRLRRTLTGLTPRELSSLQAELSSSQESHLR